MVINRDDIENKAEMLKAIAHPIRLCIVKGLIERERATVTCIQNCLDTPQSTLSQHIGKLKMAGIIKGIRNGKEINYYVSNDKIKEVIRVLFT